MQQIYEINHDVDGDDIDQIIQDASTNSVYRADETSVCLIMLPEPPTMIKHIMTEMMETTQQIDWNLWRVFDELIYLRVKEYYDKDQTQLKERETFRCLGSSEETGRFLALKHKYCLKYGEPCGTDKQYWPDGNIKWISRYEHGVLEGFEEYHTPRHITISEHHHGLRNGLQLVTSKVTGATIERSHWKDGKLHGLFTLYDEDGVLMERSQYTKDFRDGLSEQWNGDWYTKDMWKDGQLHGCKQVFFLGKLVEECHYKDGKLNGPHLIYSAKGDDLFLEQVCTYENGEKHGDYTSYWSNGNIQCCKTYDHGDVVSFVEYDRCGNVIVN
jgi:antitoxin component YwqK of YwqJK toxin-antitoxin module